MRVRLTLAPDDVVELDIVLESFTFRERHDAAVALASLVGRDEAGIVMVGPDALDQALAHAWVVLRRTRPEVRFEDLFDTARPADLDPVKAGEESDDSPEASGGGS